MKSPTNLILLIDKFNAILHESNAITSDPYLAKPGGIPQKLGDILVTSFPRKLN